jgi:hypothetical protein
MTNWKRSSEPDRAKWTKFGLDCGHMFSGYVAVLDGTATSALRPICSRPAPLKSAASVIVFVLDLKIDMRMRNTSAGYANGQKGGLRQFWISFSFFGRPFIIHHCCVLPSGINDFGSVIDVKELSRFGLLNEDSGSLRKRIYKFPKYLILWPMTTQAWE